jgi:hypothetical protein
MADFFDPEDKKQEQQENETALEKIKLGDIEYDPKELQELVEKGKFTKELNDKFNTKVENVWPEFQKKTNELKAAKEELESAKAKLQEQAASNANNPEFTEEQRKTAREQLKGLGAITQDQFDKLFEEKFTQFYQNTRGGEQILDSVNKYAKDIDGSDGRPKFDQSEILEYMKSTGINDPQLAYKIKYEKQLDAWKEEQLSKNKGTGFTTQASSGISKSPKEVIPDKSNLQSLIAESLGIE